MRSIKLTLALITLAGLISVVGLVFGTSSNAAAAASDKVNAHWKGFASFSPTGAGPNVARCGPFPENVEVTFAGSGIDNEGGILTNSVSACTKPATGEVSDLKATDTFTATGDQIFIESDPFLQVVDPGNCAVTNSQTRERLQRHSGPGLHRRQNLTTPLTKWFIMAATWRPSNHSANS